MRVVVRDSGIPQQHASGKKAASGSAEGGIAGIRGVVFDRAVSGDQVIARVCAARARVGFTGGRAMAETLPTCRRRRPRRAALTISTDTCVSHAPQRVVAAGPCESM